LFFFLFSLVSFIKTLIKETTRADDRENKAAVSQAGEVGEDSSPNLRKFCFFDQYFTQIVEKLSTPLQEEKERTNVYIGGKIRIWSSLESARSKLKYSKFDQSDLEYSNFDPNIHEKVYWKVPT